MSPALTAALTGFEFRPATTMLNVIGALPLLVAYPIGVGVATYRLSKRVREQNRLLKALNRIDGLSRLLNRTHWEQAVATEFGRHDRTGMPVCLLMLDIDHFKRINDRYGHLAGDEVIRNVAALVRQTLREYDVAGRYGGEEFGVVLPHTTAVNAVAIAERVRRRIEEATVEAEVGIRCTVSVGVAQLTADVVSTREWIERTDRALYRAKALGRNRTAQFEPDETIGKVV